MKEREKQQGDHAVVLGASMGGLLAARVLARSFERVTLVERDALPAGPENRKGVPQGRHTHALLARGAELLEGYFPGLTAALIAEGAPTGDPGLRTRMIAGGQRCRSFATGLRGLMTSRPLLESHVRKRVFELPNVQLLERHDALGLVTRDSGRRVTGVRVAPRVGEAQERVLDADLVVDTSGRGSKTPAWLRELGFEAPEEETVRVGVSYVTRIFHRQKSDLDGDLAVIVSAAPPNRRAAAALAQEGDRWTVTLVGYLGERAPTELEGYIEFARGLPAPDVYELVSRAQPLGDAISASYPASVRRRYERLRRFPERYVVMADAICGFNPIFGQGMTVAAIEATLLEATVAEGLSRVGPRFFARTAKPIDVPWSIAVGNDLRFPEVEGPRTLATRLLNGYMGRFLQTAAEDSVVSRAFFDVCNLSAAPTRLMSPAVMSRVLFGRADEPQPVRAADPA